MIIRGASRSPPAPAAQAAGAGAVATTSAMVLTVIVSLPHAAAGGGDLRRDGGAAGIDAGLPGDSGEEVRSSHVQAPAKT